MDALLRGAGTARPKSICLLPQVRWNVADTDKPKSAPLLWIVLSGFLGLFAVGTPVALNNLSGKKDADKKEADAAPFHMSGKDPLKPVYDFYATHDGKWDPEEDLRRHLHNYTIEFLI